MTRQWGHVQAAGLLRRIYWDDFVDDEVDLSRSATGWGINLSSNLKFGKRDVLRLQLATARGSRTT